MSGWKSASAGANISHGKQWLTQEPVLSDANHSLTEWRSFDSGQGRRFVECSIHRDDARLLVERLRENSLGRAFILFPTPWPKTRHHKRRIISDEVLGHLARALRDDAELRVATDDAGYLEWILWHLRRHPAFRWQASSPADWRNRPDDWPATRYQEKAVAAGRNCASRHMYASRANK